MKKYLPLAFFLAALLFAGGTYLYERAVESPIETFRHDISAYPEEHDIPKRIYETYYDTVGPETMLNIIDERPSCHLEGHNLGRVIYEHTNSLPRAAYMCKEKCYAGCMHGALLGFVDEERKITGVTGDPQPDDLTPSLMKTIVGLCDSDTITQLMPLGSCYHALGHVFAYFTDSDIPQTTKLCGMLSSKGDGAVYQCLVGMYMQRSNDYVEADMNVDASKWFPCNTGASPAACYRYRIPFVFSSTTPIVTIAKACNEMSEPDRGGCFHGLGIVTYLVAKNDPEKINAICNTTDPVAQRMCLDGVIGRLTSFGIDATDSICDAYTGMTKTECAKSEPSIYNMDRDYSAYFVPRK